MKVIKFHKNLTLKKVLALLDTTKLKCLVFSEGKKLYGTLTDGDIRRGLIKELKASSNLTNIEKYINKKPFFLKNEKFKNLTFKEKIKILNKKKEKNIDVIPIVDKKKNILKVIDLDNFLKKGSNQKINDKTPVVIMAGGKGVRLKPFTNFFPKILMPFKNTVAGDYIIKKFKSYSFEKFYISVNYKKELIQSYFSKDKDISFIKEKKFLGTIGSLSLIKDVYKNLICINCDSIINLNFSKIIDYHIKKDNDLTILVAPKKFKLPYGHLDLNTKKKIVSFVEKPTTTLLVNIGCYIIKKEMIKFIPKNKKYDINNLLNDSRIKNKKIEAFPISESSWLDIGSF